MSVVPFQLIGNAFQQEQLRSLDNPFGCRVCSMIELGIKMTQVSRQRWRFVTFWRPRRLFPRVIYSPRLIALTIDFHSLDLASIALGKFILQEDPALDVDLLVPLLMSLPYKHTRNAINSCCFRDTIESRNFLMDI